METEHRIKPNGLILPAIILSVLFFLLMPYKIVQAMCLTVVFIILLSFLYVKNLQKSLKVERTIEELKLACKEQTDISFTLKNYSRFPAFICYFFDKAPYLLVYGDKNSGLTNLRPYEIKQVTYRISAQNRGLYEVGPVRIRTSDPMGLFSLEMEIAAPLKITVRPARTRLITNTVPGFPQGLLKIQNPIYEDITMRRSVREYQNGDDQKRINWRISARFGTLFTNQYEASYDSPFFVFLNLAKEDYPLQSRSYYTEKAIEIAASIIEYSRLVKQRCGFACYGTNFPYLKPVQNQADCILDLLSLIQPEDGKLDYNPAVKFKHQLPEGTLIFVVGPDTVSHYYAKVEAGLENLNTDNLQILQKEVH